MIFFISWQLSSISIKIQHFSLISNFSSTYEHIELYQQVKRRINRTFAYGLTLKRLCLFISHDKSNNTGTIGRDCLSQHVPHTTPLLRCRPIRTYQQQYFFPVLRHGQNGLSTESVSRFRPKICRCHRPSRSKLPLSGLYQRPSSCSNGSDSYRNEELHAFTTPHRPQHPASKM